MHEALFDTEEANDPSPRARAHSVFLPLDLARPTEPAPPRQVPGLCREPQVGKDAPQLWEVGYDFNEGPFDIEGSGRMLLGQPMASIPRDFTSFPN